MTDYLQQSALSQQTQNPSDKFPRRFQEGGGLFTTISTADSKPFIGLGASTDDSGTVRLQIGSCLSREGNSFQPIVEIDVTNALVRILGQTLSVP